MTPADLAFIEAVNAEVHALRRFVALLEAEQVVLIKGGIDDLNDLARQKNELAATVSALDEQRSSVLAALGLAADHRSIETWLGTHPQEKDSRDAWSSLLALARQARDTNLLNGQLIQRRMQDNAQALETLLGTRSPVALYGPDGQSSIAGSQRFSESA